MSNVNCTYVNRNRYTKYTDILYQHICWWLFCIHYVLNSHICLVHTDAFQQIWQYFWKLQLFFFIFGLSLNFITDYFEVLWNGSEVAVFDKFCPFLCQKILAGVFPWTLPLLRQPIRPSFWSFWILIRMSAFIWVTVCWTHIRFISYSNCSIWHRISKLLSNFGCLFTFCYLDGANSIKIA